MDVVKSEPAFVDTERTKDVFVAVSGEEGAKQVISVSETTVAGAMRVTAVLPLIETSLQIGAFEDIKEDPDTVKTVPPVLGVDRGDTEVTAGVPVYEYVASKGPSKVTPLLLTERVTDVEASCLGVMHTIEVGETNVTEVERSSPNLQVMEGVSRKLDPVTVTAVPPTSGPLPGDTLRMLMPTVYVYVSSMSPGLHC